MSEFLVGIVHCDYDEGNPGSYRGHYVTIKGERFFFSTMPDPYQNKQSAVEWVSDDLKIECFVSSDADHFDMEWQEQGCFVI